MILKKSTRRKRKRKKILKKLKTKNLNMSLIGLNKEKVQIELLRQIAMLTEYNQERQGKQSDQTWVSCSILNY